MACLVHLLAVLTVMVMISMQMLSVQADVHTALADLYRLTQTENDRVFPIHEYIQVEEERLEKLRCSLKTYKSDINSILKEGLTNGLNALNSFTVRIKLFGRWQQVQKLLKAREEKEFLSQIVEMRYIQNIESPTETDLEGIMTALFRIQDTYNISTTKMADGEIPGLPSSPLSSSDCYELGRFAYKEKDNYHAVLWLTEAERRWNNDDSEEMASILAYLALALHAQGNPERAISAALEAAEMDPSTEEILHDSDWFSNDLTVETDDMPPLKNPRPEEDNMFLEGFERTCRGDYKQSPKNESKLYCHWKRDHPYLLLAPFKVEVVHLKPEVILFRDVISDDEIEEMKNISTPMLRRAKTVVGTGDADNVGRTAKNFWLGDDEYEVANTISKRLSLMTGLDMATAEKLQAGNYGIGGHYIPHHDHIQESEITKHGYHSFYTKEQGNRIATVLFYLSQPKMGGGTAFPLLKVLVPAVKNGAAFWFNVKQNGIPDFNTLHAGCPVAGGIKWVANKWIHERGQEFKRPCSKAFEDYV